MLNKALRIKLVSQLITLGLSVLHFKYHTNPHEASNRYSFFKFMSVHFIMNYDRIQKLL
jgi:hypothetical protein